MSTYDYSRFVATAKRLIDKYGVTGNLRVTATTGPVYNPTPGGVTLWPCSVFVMDYTDDEINVSQGRRLQTDKHVLMAASGLSVAPQTDYQLVLSDATYNLIPPIMPLNPGGTVIYYDLQGRL